MKIVIFDGFGEGLEVLWRALEPSSEHYVFQTYEWQRFWQETIGRQVLRISPWIAVALDAADQPRIIFPLGVQRRFGVRILEFLGRGQCDYNGPLIDRSWLSGASQVEAAWKLVSTQLPSHDVQHFNRLPARWGHENNPLLDLWKVSFQDNSYFAILPATFAKFRIPRQTNTKRQRKRLAKIGTLEFEVLGSDAGWHSGVEAMIRQKRERYRKTGVPDMLSDSTIQRFYRDVPKILAATGYIHLAVLKLNGEILATHWGAVYRDRFYWLMPTFDERKWGAYSTGYMLLEGLVEWCIQNNLKFFDFTIGGENYKKEWCDGEMALFQHLRAVTLFGFPYVAYVRIRQRARRNERYWSIIRKIYSRARYGWRAET